ncbi:MAG: hypothetical protein E7211_00660 [Clostridium lundense]|nr:hypothetical protein [Clostridium lundense]
MMDIVIIIGVMIIIAGIIRMAESAKKEIEKQKEYDLIGHCHYYGGYEDKMDTEYISLYNNKDEILVSFTNEERKILIRDIKDLTTKREEQLKQEVTLGRFVLVGALAFLWKKNKVENRKFVILTYYDQTENKDRNILFESPKAEKIYQQLKDIINEFKESNQAFVSNKYENIDC